MQFNVWTVLCWVFSPFSVIINDGLALFVLLCRGAGSKGQAVSSQHSSSSTAVAPAYVPREFSAGCSVFGEAAGESNFGNTCYER